MRTWEFATGTAAQTQELAGQLAQLLRAGDLIILSGGLGAGKTTFTQGLGRGLGVREGIISPTFVLVRIHPNLPDGPNPGGPNLVHVDAYRLSSSGEIDDIDLENTLDSSVTVVEWGVDRVEHLAESRLDIELLRASGSASAGPGHDPVDGTGGDSSFDVEGDDDEPRTLRLSACGPRWHGVDFAVLGQTASQEKGTT